MRTRKLWKLAQVMIMIVCCSKLYSKMFREDGVGL